MIMLELAWQTYYDVPGRPTAGGYGDFDLDQHG